MRDRGWGIQQPGYLRYGQVVKFRQGNDDFLPRFPHLSALSRTRLSGADVGALLASGRQTSSQVSVVVIQQEVHCFAVVLRVHLSAAASDEAVVERGAMSSQEALAVCVSPAP